MPQLSVGRLLPGHRALSFAATKPGPARVPWPSEHHRHPYARGVSDTCLIFQGSTSNAVGSPLNQPSSAACSREPRVRTSGVPAAQQSFQRAPASCGEAGASWQDELPGAKSGRMHLPPAPLGSGGTGELPLRSDPKSSPYSSIKRRCERGVKATGPGCGEQTGAQPPGDGGGPGDLLQHQEMLWCARQRAEQTDHRFQRALAMPASLSAFHNTPNQPSLPPQTLTYVPLMPEQGAF